MLMLSRLSMIKSLQKPLTVPYRAHISIQQHRPQPPGIFVLNAGSSSLKFNLYEREQEGQSLIFSGSAVGLTISGDVAPRIEIKSKQKTVLSQSLDSGSHSSALDIIANFINTQYSSGVSAVGHRIVHGGTMFLNSCILTPDVMANLHALNSLAPLHNPHNIAGIQAASSAFPHAVQVGVFDTSFHSSLPPKAYTYPLPWYLATKYRKYGFHGTSHKFVVDQARKFLGKEKINAISFHLGNGCSAACIKDNKSIDTTMGYTPLAGLPMGSRSGDVDPSIIIKLIQDEGLTAEEVNGLLHNDSGIYGICGSSDSATAEKGYENDEPLSSLAFQIFAYNVKKCLGAYSAVLDNSVDCVIFTGGVGENSTFLHNLVCDGLLPISHDNFLRSCAISDITSKVTSESCTTRAATKVLVIKTNEELAIANECLKFLEH